MQRYLMLVFVFACGGSPVQFGLPSGVDPGGDGGSPVGAGSTDGGASGLPCDVAAFLQTNCDSCHGNPPSANAPISIMTYSDLMQPAPLAPSRNVAQESVVRMQSATSPMPPGTHLAASDIAILQNWIDAGTPMGTCGSGMDAGPAMPVCTSGQYWSSTGDGSSRMDPGRACIACHSQGDGPWFQFAGTVYPTEHEPDECIGASAITVIVTDAAGHSVTTTTNRSGNFFSEASSLQLPITAVVQTSRGTRAMTTPQMSGDCNSCHTESGNSGAPGRIFEP